MSIFRAVDRSHEHLRASRTSSTSISASLHPACSRDLVGRTWASLSKAEPSASRMMTPNTLRTVQQDAEMHHRYQQPATTTTSTCSPSPLGTTAARGISLRLSACSRSDRRRASGRSRGVGPVEHARPTAMIQRSSDICVRLCSALLQLPTFANSK